MGFNSGFKGLKSQLEFSIIAMDDMSDSE